MTSGRSLMYSWEIVEPRMGSHALILIVMSLTRYIMGWLKIQNLNILRTTHNFSTKKKKILNLYFRWHILRSNCFVAEVTLKYKNHDETFQQSGKQDFFSRILKSSASMYESSGSQFFRTTTGLQSGP